MQDSDDDFALFQANMRGVKPLEYDRADTGKPKADLKRVAYTRETASRHTQQAQRVDGLSDLFVIDVGAEDALYWARDGVQEGQMRKLKAGQIPFEGHLDLHGQKVEAARELIWTFLAEAARYEIRCTRITHGKAARLDGKSPILKSHVNTWLRQHPQVLGFSSCQPKHGGTGSLYVLLKRTMLEGRDEH